MSARPPPGVGAGPSGLTPSLVENPTLDRWIRFPPGDTVRVATGKVELGQGIVTALAQIAAEELDIPLDRVEVLSGSSAEGPDELYTTSSLSVEISGASVRLVCAEVRSRMLDRLAQRLNCGRDELDVREGEFVRGGAPTGYDYWKLAPEVDLVSPITGPPPLKPPGSYRVVGQSVPRRDLPAKLTGAAFVHDLERPDMLHARTLRQPQRGAVLEALDEDAVRGAAGAAGAEIRIVRRGSFVAFVSADETAVQAAAAAAPAHARWTGVRAIDPSEQTAAWLRGRPSIDRVLGDPPRSASGGETVTATFSRPYVAHAALAPSCALAQWRDGHLTIWSHGQGMHPLRRTVSAALGLSPEAVTCHHVQGAGCYGHNGADDAALDAALVALEIPERCIRLQWRREEEFGFEPVGTAMLVDLEVVLDDAGRPADWTTEIWSGTHVQRPGLTGGGNLLAAEALPEPAPEPAVQDPPEERGGGATRNAVPLYDVPAHRIVHHLVPHTPVRTSALRGLGALPNVFAIESMLDDLALAAGEDPLAYRLTILSEPRARRVLETAAQRAGWSERGPGGNGRGFGLAFARYKNRAAYAAVVASVAVDEAVRVERVWCVADAGLVVNPDGARNQLEGGIVQALSWTLKEQVRIEGEGITSLDWDGYPILRFSELPEIDADLLDAPEERSLGVGECSVGPTAAAVGNAVAHALGARIRELPLTRERIVGVLLS